MSQRYAIYYAPHSDDPWWDFGCHWLGRDPEGGYDVEQTHVDGLSPERLESLTRQPRRYGFHATFKSPFTLAADRNEFDLFESMNEFAQTQRAVMVRDIQPTLMDSFVALRPTQPTAPLARLAQNCLERFDRFRVPPSGDERARRVARGLTPDQLSALDRWGYPYAGPTYRFHLTLTSTVQRVEADLVCTHVHGELERRGLRHLLIDNLAIFKQPVADAPFQLLRRFPLCG